MIPKKKFKIGEKVVYYKPFKSTLGNYTPIGTVLTISGYSPRDKKNPDSSYVKDHGYWILSFSDMGDKSGTNVEDCYRSLFPLERML